MCLVLHHFNGTSRNESFHISSLQLSGSSLLCKMTDDKDNSDRENDNCVSHKLRHMLRVAWQGMYIHFDSVWCEGQILRL